MKLVTKKRIDCWLGGIGILLLRPIARVLGAILARDHSLEPRGRVAVVKVFGGGSLVLASQAVLGVKRRYPDLPLILVCTPPVATFAHALNIFDDLVVINDTGVTGLLTSAPSVLIKLWRVDTLIDLEPYSRLSSVLATLSLARNRHGFYLETAFWREGLATHLVFFNRFAPVTDLYGAMCRLLRASPVERIDVARHVAAALGVETCEDPQDGRYTECTAPATLCIGHACSELGQERMLNSGQWMRVLLEILPSGVKRIVVLGSARDQETAEELVRMGRQSFSSLEWENAADGRSLGASLRLLASSGYFVGVDSGLLHFARLFGVPSRSFWGPTDPATRLDSPSGSWERRYYARTVCSPCIHVAEQPPCGGRNACIEAAVRAVGDVRAGQAFASTVEAPIHAPAQARQ